LKVKNGSKAKMMVSYVNFHPSSWNLDKSVGPSVAPDFYDKLFTFLAAVMRCSLFCIVYLAFCDMLACMVF
jgi:hypothetical protein